MMYESPITLLRTQTDNFVKEVNEKTDEVIFKAVVNVFPQVNKEELIKALEYDRGQYIKGYQDRDKEIVRCKDCKWYMLTDHNETEVCTNKQWDISMAVYPIISADGFCSYGERGDNSYGERAEQTEYKLPGHDEVMEALDKLTIRKVTDKDETEYLNRTFRHDDGEWHDLTDTLTESHGRLIDADTVVTVQVFDEMYEEYNLMTMTIAEALDLWTEEGCPPTVQAVPRSLYENLLLRKDRPHGEWLKIDKYFEAFNETVTNYKCSVCEFEPYFGGHIERYKYCPNCGAQMNMRWESEEDV